MLYFLRNQPVFLIMKKVRIFLVILIAILFVSGGVWYWKFYQPKKISQPSTNSNTSQAAPALPSEPKDADAATKTNYAKAIAARDTRLKDPTYINFLKEGIAWKTTADYTKSDKNVFYTYAAYVYTQAGGAFPKEWVPWFNTGNMFLSIADYNRAETSYKKAIELAPAQYDPLSALLDILRARSAQPNRQVMDYFKDRLPLIGSNQSPLTIGYCQYLLEYNELNECLAVLKSIIAINPTPQLQSEYADLQKFVKENAAKNVNAK